MSDKDAVEGDNASSVESTNECEVSHGTELLLDRIQYIYQSSAAVRTFNRSRLLVKVFITDVEASGRVTYDIKCPSCEKSGAYIFPFLNKETHEIISSFINKKEFIMSKYKKRIGYPDLYEEMSCENVMLRIFKKIASSLLRDTGALPPIFEKSKCNLSIVSKMDIVWLLIHPNYTGMVTYMLDIAMNEIRNRDVRLVHVVCPTEEDIYVYSKPTLKTKFRVKFCPHPYGDEAEAAEEAEEEEAEEEKEVEEQVEEAEVEEEEAEEVEEEEEAEEEEEEEEEEETEEEVEETEEMEEAEEEISGEMKEETSNKGQKYNCEKNGRMKKVYVRLLDYGDRLEVPLKNLFHLKDVCPELLSVPAQAVRVRVLALDKSMTDMKSKLSEILQNKASLYVTTLDLGLGDTIPPLVELKKFK